VPSWQSVGQMKQHSRLPNYLSKRLGLCAAFEIICGLGLDYLRPLLGISRVKLNTSICDYFADCVTVPDVLMSIRDLKYEPVHMLS